MSGRTLTRHANTFRRTVAVLTFFGLMLAPLGWFHHLAITGIAYVAGHLLWWKAEHILETPAAKEDLEESREERWRERYGPRPTVSFEDRIIVVVLLILFVGF